MACPSLGNKALTKPLMTHQSHSKEQTSLMIFYIKQFKYID